MNSRIAGILRNKTFSPNSDDHAIMVAVGNGLREKGCEVTFMEEGELLKKRPEATTVFSMARSEEALAVLEQMEGLGTVVVNPAEGVRSCLRPVVTLLMQNNGVPVPPSWVLKAPYGIPDCPFPCWLKRGDASAQTKDDVRFLNSGDELAAAFRTFEERGIESAVVSGHVAGDVVKFYGVAGTPFFYWYYPTLGLTHSKFGLEAFNGPAQQFAFDEEALKEMADRVAQIAQTPVYGGDGIVNAQGEIRIIDFNDWPSFSRCLDDAAKAIVQLILNKI